MPKNVKASVFARPFALDAGTIERINRVMSFESSTPIYVAQCRDGSTVTFENADELLQFPNPPTRPIHTLQVSNSVDSSPHIRLRFGGETDSSPITYEISGDDADVLRLERDIKEAIYPRLQKPAWAAIPGNSYKALMYIGGVAAFGFLGSSLLTIYFNQGRPERESEFSGSIRTGTLCFFVGIVIVLISYIRPRLFPYAAFLIGDGENRFNLLMSRRKLILITVLGSGVALPFLRDWLLRALSL